VRLREGVYFNVTSQHHQGNSSWLCLHFIDISYFVFHSILLVFFKKKICVDVFSFCKPMVSSAYNRRY